MPENAVEVKDIDNISTKTAIRKIMDKGEEVDRVLVTKVTFEGAIDPGDIAQIHRLLKAGHNVNISIWSPQLVMDLEEAEKITE